MTPSTFKSRKKYNKNENKIKKIENKYTIRRINKAKS